MAGTCPSVIWVMLQTFPLWGRAEGTGRFLKPQKKLFPRSAGALGAGPHAPRCLSQAGWQSLPSQMNEVEGKTSSWFVGAAATAVPSSSRAAICVKTLRGRHSWWIKGINAHNQAGSKRCCCAIKENISESSSCVTVSILKCSNLQMCLKKQTQPFTGMPLKSVQTLICLIKG